MFSESLPYFYFEMGQLLLTECSEEFENAKHVKSLLEDIFELRREKLMKMMKKIDPDQPVLFLSTCGSAELNYVRPGFSAAYSVVNKM